MLAQPYALTYGIDIVAYTEYLDDHRMITDLIASVHIPERPYGRVKSITSVIVGCADHAHTRKLLHHDTFFNAHEGFIQFEAAAMDHAVEILLSSVKFLFQEPFAVHTERGMTPLQKDIMHKISY
ncbi:hypothetical protein [Sulfoacidibacillus ferrooxidans]|uniref:Uncharacterized protein n=1 Tax=Sulfoacidibacillus ferrooxidans TaxID=2005001 RepID=A0A9X1VA67_9BACL|nr:hypothetical protein [Sulfoacidibacillus ferrooxidans]MCI0184218.1 hypothetical protein [Sulfoacidibacillus ferrooxidans]